MSPNYSYQSVDVTDCRKSLSKLNRQICLYLNSIENRPNLSISLFGITDCCRKDDSWNGWLLEPMWILSQIYFHQSVWCNRLLEKIRLLESMAPEVNGSWSLCEFYHKNISISLFDEQTVEIYVILKILILLASMCSFYTQKSYTNCW